LTLHRLQLVLVLTAAAAAIVMVGLLSSGARIACLGVVLAGAWLTEPERSRRGGGWRLLIGAGAALATVGFAVAELSEPAETAAGIVAIAGSALVIAGATIGFPTK
jgi:O-antigen ligase